MRINEFSAKQRAVLDHVTDEEHTMLLAGGSIRSGKSFSSMASFATWILHEGMDNDHALIGYSVETAMRNVGNPMLDFYRSIGVKAEFTKNLGSRILLRFAGKETIVWVIGASTTQATDRIQGATLKGMLIDEIVLIPEEFFMQAWGRLSVDGAKLWGTYNPAAPRHWFKRKVIDRIADYDGHVVAFHLDDNPTLSKSVKVRYEKSYTGHFYDRLIRGEWVGAAGLIFPRWYPVEEDLPGEHYEFSLDWGVAGVFAALAFHTRQPKAHAVSELYYDARNESSCRTEAEHLHHFVTWAEGFPRTHKMRPRVWVDPSTPASFKRLLRENGFIVRHGSNEVIPGIVTTGSRLASGDLRIGDCPNLIRELDSYQWDAKKSDEGLDVPVKQDDHTVDALRYFAHSTGKAYRMAPTPARRLL